jgi:signal transduction histidine kinase
VVDNECLTYVADRLDALGGRLEIEAASGAGTKLRARLPILAVQSV